MVIHQLLLWFSRKTKTTKKNLVIRTKMKTDLQDSDILKSSSIIFDSRVSWKELKKKTAEN